MTRKSTKSKRATSFRAARSQHSNEIAEDYTELILELSEKHGEARTCTIAQELGVSHVTAVRTIQRLQVDGWVKTAPHKPVVLTAKGKRLAHSARVRHQITLGLLLKLGVPQEVAEVDAEGVEHHLSPVTLRHIEAFLDVNRRA